MADEIFSSYRFLAVVVSIALATILQSWWPHTATLRMLIRNWRVNYSIAALNAIFLGTVTRTWLPVLIAAAETNPRGLFLLWGVPYVAQLILSVAILDFLAFAWHIANHRSKFLWRFHAMHHSNQLLDASTAFRFHLGEILISLVVRVAVIWLFGMPFFGVLAFEMFFLLANTLVHSDIQVAPRLEKFLSYVVITPAVHRKHHSLNMVELNSNFGTIFSWWDKLAATWRYGASKERFSVGLQTVNKASSEKVLSLLQSPWC